jgi:hypothetical protein
VKTSNLTILTKFAHSGTTAQMELQTYPQPVQQPNSKTPMYIYEWRVNENSRHADLIAQ